MPVAKIDPKKCNGCGRCVDTCPEDVFRLNIQPVQHELKSPCAQGCPAGISVIMPLFQEGNELFHGFQREVPYLAEIQREQRRMVLLRDAGVLECGQPVVVAFI